MEPLPWYEKSNRRGLIIQLGLILITFIVAYIANTGGVDAMETIIIVTIIAMIIVISVSLYRGIKGQSIYWWTGHPDTTWEGNKARARKKGKVKDNKYAKEALRRLIEDNREVFHRLARAQEDT